MTIGDAVVAHQPSPGPFRFPILISALASLWLWFGYVSSLQKKSTGLQQRISEAESVLAGIHGETALLRDLEQKLPILEQEWNTIRQTLWTAEEGDSLLSHIDGMARSAEVRIESFSARPGKGTPGALRYWKCDLRASFRQLLVFLQEVSRSRRIVHIRSLTIRPSPADHRTPRLLQLSLLLAAPSAGDHLR